MSGLSGADRLPNQSSSRSVSCWRNLSIKPATLRGPAVLSVTPRAWAPKARLLTLGAVDRRPCFCQLYLPKPYRTVKLTELVVTVCEPLAAWADADHVPRGSFGPIL